jgi:hypothetical protein
MWSVTRQLNDSKPLLKGLFAFLQSSFRAELIPIAMPDIVEMAKQEIIMSALRCKVGDIAVTVQCELPENLGKIVRIVKYRGLKKWARFDRPLHLWLVEVVGESRLTYQYPSGRTRRRLKGLEPDIFLRPITDPKELLTITTTAELTLGEEAQNV